MIKKQLSIARSGSMLKSYVFIMYLFSNSNVCLTVQILMFNFIDKSDILLWNNWENLKEFIIAGDWETLSLDLAVFETIFEFEGSEEQVIIYDEFFL